MTSPRNHPALKAGSTAVVTGGANGIGLSSACRFAGLGMNVIIADRDAVQLETALPVVQEAASGDAKVSTFVCDVSDPVQVESLASYAYNHFDDVAVLMNNAGTAFNPGLPWDKLSEWKKLIDINLWGIIHCVQTFVPSMLEHGKPGLVINTGSKQGITKPPGNAAYNLSKAGVVAFTESLAYEFRQRENCPLTAHLLVPGFTYTGMISQFLPEKPDAAWTSDQVSSHMLERIEGGDFYIICPDNDVSREMDERRIQWYADDLIKNRPPLSRWHPDFSEEFSSFMNRKT